MTDALRLEVVRKDVRPLEETQPGEGTGVIRQPRRGTNA